MVGAQVDEPESAMMPVADGLQHFVVLKSQLLRRRVDFMFQPHIDAEAVDTIRSAMGIISAIFSSGVRPSNPFRWQCRSQIKTGTAAQTAPAGPDVSR